MLGGEVHDGVDLPVPEQKKKKKTTTDEDGNSRGHSCKQDMKDAEVTLRVPVGSFLITSCCQVITTWTITPTRCVCLRTAFNSLCFRVTGVA